MRSFESAAKGLIERIGQDNSELIHHGRQPEMLIKKVSCPNHEEAIRIAIDALKCPSHGVISSENQICGVGHRVVHGAEDIKESVLIDKKVIRTISKYSELAPLHNPPSLLGITACLKVLPKVPQVAVFDTAFHQAMPEKAYIYGLPYEYYKKYKIRRYGFHGTSHRFVAHEAARILRKSLASLKIITCHLGNGCSMAAVKYGKSIDTSMGLTPLEGLLMGTRCGDLDPAIVTFLIEKEEKGFNEINTLLNKNSGLLGVSGVSNDMRDINKAAKGGSRQAKLAKEIFVYRIEKYIGAYTAVMGGCDAIILTAGVGENQPWIKIKIEKDLSNLFKRFKTKILVIPTNEELLIAKDTKDIIVSSCKTKKTKTAAS